jgi:hypothetical protein
LKAQGEGVFWGAEFPARFAIFSRLASEAYLLRFWAREVFMASCAIAETTHITTNAASTTIE